MIRICSMTLAVAALALGGVRAAEMTAWNQEAAAEAAKSFEQTVSDIYTSLKLEDGAPQARQNKTFLVAEDIRTLQRWSRRLATQLAAGESRDDTEPLFQRTLRIVDRLRETMPGIPAFASHTDDIKKARAQLEALAPLYGVTLPAPVAAPGASD